MGHTLCLEQAIDTMIHLYGYINTLLLQDMLGWAPALPVTLLGL